VPAGIQQHPLPELNDEATFLGNRNELFRSYISPLRMRPTHERLNAVDTAASEIELRLVVLMQLAPLQGPSQLLLQ
jgi:hypothetical protein